MSEMPDELYVDRSFHAWHVGNIKLAHVTHYVLASRLEEALGEVERLKRGLLKTFDSLCEKCRDGHEISAETRARINSVIQRDEPSDSSSADWVLVPRVPTVDMIVEATEQWLCIAAKEDRAEVIWDVMLATAPKPPKSESDGSSQKTNPNGGR